MIFAYYVVPIPILFTRIFLSLATGSGNLNNLKGSPYNVIFYLVARFNVIFLSLFRGG